MSLNFGTVGDQIRVKKKNTLCRNSRPRLARGQPRINLVNPYTYFVDTDLLSLRSTKYKYIWPIYMANIYWRTERSIYLVFEEKYYELGTVHILRTR